MAEYKVSFPDAAKTFAPEQTALIVIDMQVDMGSPEGSFAQSGRDVSHVAGIVPNIKRLIDAARESGALVVYIQQMTLPDDHSDGEAWLAFKRRDGKKADYCLRGTHGYDIMKELEPLPNDITVPKFRPSAFHGTFLDQILRAHKIKSCVHVGNTTEGCVLATVMDCAFHDYYTGVVRDAVASSVDKVHDAAITLMEMRYRMLTTDEVVDIWRSAKK